MGESTPPTASAAGTKELRGSVLDVLRVLLSEGRADAVVELVTQLVNHNRDLELLLAHVRMGKNTSERVAADQLDLFLKKLAEQTPPGALAEATKKLTESAEKNGGRPEKEKPPKQPSVRRPIPDDLQRVDNPIPVPPAERPCPSCGKERKCVGHETTPVIEYKPGEVFVRNDRREVLACADCDGEMTRAPMGDKVVSGGAYGSRLVAHLVVDKYLRGMPLYRQGEELAALGFEMPSSSMADQIMWATDLLRPIQKGLIRSALKAHVMHLDATSLAVRDKESPKGIRLGALWAYVGTGEEPVAAYVYASTGKKVAQRPGEIGPEEMLARRRGFVCADASNLFDASFASGTCIEIGCNMHARRYFVLVELVLGVAAVTPALLGAVLQGLLGVKLGEAPLGGVGREIVVAARAGIGREQRGAGRDGDRAGGRGRGARGVEVLWLVHRAGGEEDDAERGQQQGGAGEHRRGSSSRPRTAEEQARMFDGHSGCARGNLHAMDAKDPRNLPGNGGRSTERRAAPRFTRRGGGPPGARFASDALVACNARVSHAEAACSPYGAERLATARPRKGPRAFRRARGVHSARPWRGFEEMSLDARREIGEQERSCRRKTRRARGGATS